MSTKKADSAAREPAANPCVLLVEDEPAAREACARYLKRCGFCVIVAKNAKTAVEQAARCRPDVLVSDWRLGAGRDGVDVGRELQQRYGVPIVFLTAYPVDELRDASCDLDVIDYMAKPVSLAALADTLSSFAS